MIRRALGEEARETVSRGGGLSLHWVEDSSVLLSRFRDFAATLSKVEIHWRVLSIRMKVKVLVTQSCLTFCDSMHCSPPASSVHGILPARMLEWVAIPFSRGSSWPSDRTQVSCTADIFFTVWATRVKQQHDITCILGKLWLLCNQRQQQKNQPGGHWRRRGERGLSPAPAGW